MVRVAFPCLCLAVLASCHGGDAGNEAAAASGTIHFVNSPDNARSLALRDHYVDFSFDYPARWSLTPQPIDGTAQNYVRVAAPMVNGYEPYAFLVGFAAGTGNAARDRASLPTATLDLAARFGASLQDYRIVSSGPGRVGGRESYGWRFTASGPGPEAEPRVQIYGRGDLILPPGASRGVALVTLATSRAADIHSAAEVGEHGVLKAILDSFRLTNVQAGPAAAPASTPAAVNATAPIGAVPAPAPRQIAPPPLPRPATLPVTPARPAAPSPAAPPRPFPTTPPAQPAAPAAPERPKQETPSPAAPPRVPPPGNGQ